MAPRGERWRPASATAKMFPVQGHQPASGSACKLALSRRHLESCTSEVSLGSPMHAALFASELSGGAQLSSTARLQRVEQGHAARPAPWRQQLEALDDAGHAIKSLARSADRRFEQISLQFESAVRELAGPEALAPTLEAEQWSEQPSEVLPCAAGALLQGVPEAVESRLDVTEQQLQRLEKAMESSGARLAELEARLASQDAAEDAALLSARAEESAPGLARNGIVERTMALQLDQLSAHIAAIGEDEEFPRSAWKPEVEALGRDIRQVEDRLEDRISKLNQKVELAFESVTAEIITEKVESLGQRLSASEARLESVTTAKIQDLVQRVSATEARLELATSEILGEKIDNLMQQVSANEAKLLQFDQDLRALSTVAEKSNCAQAMASADEVKALPDKVKVPEKRPADTTQPCRIVIVSPEQDAQTWRPSPVQSPSSSHVSQATEKQSVESDSLSSIEEEAYLQD